MRGTITLRVLAFAVASAMMVSVFAGCNSKPISTSSDPETTATTTRPTAGASDTLTSKETAASTESGGEDTGTTTRADATGKTTTKAGNSHSTTTKAGGNSQSAGKTTATATTTTTKKTPTTTKAQNQERISFYKNMIKNESDWLTTLQLDNGAVGMTNDTWQRTINPYFAEITMLALLDSGKTYANNVKKYMDWHFDHLNTAKTDYNGVDGTIYDYEIVTTGGGTTNVISEEVKYNDKGKPQYDSTDSYAALFLSVLWRYYEETGDAAYIKANYSDINRIVNALFATMDNGLTWAKPDYRVKYFMDNAEVYEGLVDAAKLYEKVLVPAFSSGSSEKAGATAKLKQITEGRDLVYATIEKVFWNEKDGYYYSSCTGKSSVASFNWNTFYADATCQAFAITTGLLDPNSARAQRIWKNFNSRYAGQGKQHNWPGFDIPDSFYWSVLAYSGSLVGDVKNVDDYTKIYMSYPGKKHSWPLYNADCAQAVRAAHVMLKYYGG